MKTNLIASPKQIVRIAFPKCIYLFFFQKNSIAFEVKRKFVCSDALSLQTAINNFHLWQEWNIFLRYWKTGKEVGGRRRALNTYGLITGERQRQGGVEGEREWERSDIFTEKSHRVRREWGKDKKKARMLCKTENQSQRQKRTWESEQR